MSQIVTFEFSHSAVPTTGETVVGTITAPAGNDLEVKAVQASLLDTASAATPVTWRLRRYTTSGTGQAGAIAAQKLNGRKTATIGATAQGAGTGFTVAPTAASGSPQDGATIPFSSNFFGQYPNKIDPEQREPFIVAAGETVGVTVERNGGTAAGTPGARALVQVRE